MIYKIIRKIKSIFGIYNKPKVSESEIDNLIDLYELTHERVHILKVDQPKCGKDKK